jgi:prepilin-type N-terminal cleavage/methylation domain-containing protein
MAFDLAKAEPIHHSELLERVRSLLYHFNERDMPVRDHDLVCSGGRVRISFHDARSRSTAFTLVELLVVIAVIAVLAALLLPALSRSKMQALSTICLANEKQLELAWHLYASDNRSRLVSNTWAAPMTGDFNETGWIYGVDIGSESSPAGITSIQNGLLFPYIGNRKTYRCPAENQIQIDGGLNFVTRNYGMSGQMNGYSG